MKRWSARWAAVLLVMSVLSPIASTRVASAAPNDTCTLSGGPADGFEFHWLEFVGSQVPFVVAKASGQCTSIHGGVSRVNAEMDGGLDAGWTSVSSFGKCDPYRPGTSLLAAVDFTLKVSGKKASQTDYQVRWPSTRANLPRADFPGPMVSYGDLFLRGSYQTPIGYVGLSTRIGGRCPPDGNFSARYTIVFTL